MGGKKVFKKRFHKLRTWQLLLLFVPLFFLTITFYRFDHIRMTELRDDVLAADENGDGEELSSALTSLRDFTFSHTIINIVDDNGREKLIFGTGPFYLEQTYLRDANAAIESAEKNLTDGSNPNGNIFAAASDVCKPIAAANGWNWNSDGYINCMMSELDKHPASAELTTTLLADIPSTELYRYEYSSPLITFSFSSIFSLICLVVIVVIFTRFLIWLILKIALFFI